MTNDLLVPEDVLLKLQQLVQKDTGLPIRSCVVPVPNNIRPQKMSLYACVQAPDFLPISQSAVACAELPAVILLHVLWT